MLNFQRYLVLQSGTHETEIFVLLEDFLWVREFTVEGGIMFSD
jgi:hypothetical protein